MSTDTLDSLTDAQLSEAFAVEVAGEHPNDIKAAKAGDEDWHRECPLPFATSADAVLPFTETQAYFGAAHTCDGWNITVGDKNVFRQNISVHAPTFARAACIALIRAKRATPKPAVSELIDGC